MVLRNDQTVQQLASEFQKTDDSSFAHESLISSYLALPGLIAFYPMSVATLSGSVIDLGGNDLFLTNLNTVEILAQEKPVALFQTANFEVLYSNQASFDIRGNEAYIGSSYRGLTMGAWVYFNDTGQTHSIMGKWSTVAGNRSYLLHCTASNKLRMLVCGDGTNFDFVEYPTSITAQKWHFIVGRFDPSTEVKIWVNDDSEIEVASIPATLHDGTASFTVGAEGTSPAPFGAYMEGMVSMGFITATRLSDATIRRLYYRTRPAFQSRADW